MVLRDTDESSVDGEVSFFSSNDGTEIYRPKLIIDYCIP